MNKFLHYKYIILIKNNWTTWKRNSSRAASPSLSKQQYIYKCIQLNSFFILSLYYYILFLSFCFVIKNLKDTHFFFHLSTKKKKKKKETHEKTNQESTSILLSIHHLSHGPRVHQTLLLPLSSWPKQIGPKPTFLLLIIIIINPTFQSWNKSQRSTLGEHILAA